MLNKFRMLRWRERSNNKKNRGNGHGNKRPRGRATAQATASSCVPAVELLWVVKTGVLKKQHLC